VERCLACQAVVNKGKIVTYAQFSQRSTSRFSAFHARAQRVDALVLRAALLTNGLASEAALQGVSATNQIPPRLPGCANPIPRLPPITSHKKKSASTCLQSGGARV
jgi:hypothetical protein